jgi:hypothetical protein
MPRVIVITDDQGKAIGRFEAPDGATADEIRQQYDRYKQELLARRAQREAARTEPQTSQVLCQVCRLPQPARSIGAHVRDKHKLGMDHDI